MRMSPARHKVNLVEDTLWTHLPNFVVSAIWGILFWKLDLIQIYSSCPFLIKNFNYMFDELKWISISWNWQQLSCFFKWSEKISRALLQGFFKEKWHSEGNLLLLKKTGPARHYNYCQENWSINFGRFNITICHLGITYHLNMQSGNTDFRL